MENTGPFLVFLFVIIVGGAVVLSLAFRRTMGDADREWPFDVVADWFEGLQRVRQRTERASAEVSPEKTIARWQQMAERLEVDLTGDDLETSPRLRGEVDGVEIEVRRVIDANHNPGVVYEADVSETVPATFGMRPQAISETWTGLGMANHDDIYVGDSELDNAFDFHGRDEEAVRQFVWQDGVEQTLRTLDDFPQGTAIIEGRLETSQRGALPSAEHGADMIRKMVDFAHRLRQVVEDEEPKRTEGDDNEGWETPS